MCQKMHLNCTETHPDMVDKKIILAHLAHVTHIFVIHDNSHIFQLHHQISGLFSRPKRGRINALPSRNTTDRVNKY